MRHRLITKTSMIAALGLVCGVIMAYAAGHAPEKTGEVVSIPQEAGTYFDMNCAIIEGSGNVEDAAAEGNTIASTGENTVVTFNIDNPVEQAYNFTMSTGNKNTAVIAVTLYDSESKAVYNGTHKVENTGSWARSITSNHFINTLPVGRYTLELKVTEKGEATNFAGNWGKMAFYATEGDNCHFSIPGTLALVANDSEVETSDIRLNDGLLDYIKNNGTITFKNVHAHKTGVYKLVLPIDNSYGTGTLQVQVKNAETGAVEAYYNDVLTKNNSKWEEIEFALTGEITEGYKNIVMTFGSGPSSFACDTHDPQFVYVGEYKDPDQDDCHFHIPGTLEFVMNDPAVEFSTNNGGTVPRYQAGSELVNVGYVKNGGVMTMRDVVCHKAGVYEITMPFSAYTPSGIINWQVVDKATGNVEVDFDYEIPTELTNYTPGTFLLGGQITEGTKDFIITMKANHGGWIANFKQPTFEWVGEKYAEVKTIEMVGQEVVAGETTDWEVMLPGNYGSDVITIKPVVTNGKIELTAKDADDADVAVTTAADGAYTLPAPAPNGVYVITATLTPDEGVFSSKTVYTMRVFRIGGLTVTDVLVDGHSIDADVVAALNEDAGATTVEGVYTAMPVIVAKFIDNSEVEAVAGEVKDGKVEYTFKGELAGNTKDYTITVDGIHLYTKADNEESVSVKHNGGTQTGSAWANADGYGLSFVSDGYNANFRIWKSGESTISVPGDVIVKQLIFKNISNDYSSSEARIWTVESEGATVWLPTNSYYDNGVKYDLIVNIEDHKAGAPITFSFGDGKGDGGRLTFELEFTVAHQALTTTPELRTSEIIMPANSNHFVAKLTFDRVIKAAEIEFEGAKVAARGESSVLYFPVWNLAYDKDYTFTIPANTLTDLYGNVYDKVIALPVKTGEKAIVAAAGFDYVVSSVDEWKAALAAVNVSNKTADAEPVVIFVRNGDYDFGAEEQTFRTYNVSVIGESRDGVLLHGTRDGISNPVISTRYAYNMYLQDLTLRNDLDWNKARAGIGVALYSGDHEVGVNLALQSQQDTQVTGASSYYYNCDIYGSTDYICGGGNNVYDRCTMLMTNSGPITAPSTSPSDIYGYVFLNCTIDAYNKDVKDGGYSLGRPWHNEPRANFLNTTMMIKASDNGWDKMSNLPTHFYEYNSMDASGNPIDLSVRGNSPTHVGPAYTPILTDEEAARFTVENVLGETDSYLATEVAAQCEAPAAAIVTVGARAALNSIEWSAVEGARCYAIYKDGAYVDHTTETNYQPEETGNYTVRAANARGGLGEASKAVTVGETSGIESIGANATGVAEVEYYNAQGQRIDENSKGLRIRVEILNDGSRVVTKEIAK